LNISERKAWEKHRRKERIIDMAETVFHRKGYAGTTLPAVAEAAGYHRRTLYLYFRDKEDLFLAVALRALETLRAGMQAAAASDGTLRGLAMAFFDFAMRCPEDLALIMDYEARHFNDLTSRDENRAAAEHQAACQQTSEAIMEVVTSAIADGMAAGTIQTPLTPRQLMLILWGQIFGVMQVLHMRASHFETAFGTDRRHLFAHFVTMIEAALAGPDRPAARRPQE
jgi:AcrR family transcriptional regulator